MRYEHCIKITSEFLTTVKSLTQDFLAENFSRKANDNLNIIYVFVFSFSVDVVKQIVIPSVFVSSEAANTLKGDYMYDKG